VIGEMRRFTLFSDLVFFAFLVLCTEMAIAKEETPLRWKSEKVV